MSRSIAPPCRAALEKMTRLHPKRSRASDGICGDDRHQGKKSDQNAGEAFDLTHETRQGRRLRLDLRVAPCASPVRQGRTREVGHLQSPNLQPTHFAVGALGTETSNRGFGP